MTRDLLPTTATAIAVTGSSGAACTARLNGGVIPVQLSRDLTVAVGDVLLVHYVAGRYIGCCRLFPAAATPDPDEEFDQPDPNTPTVQGDTVIMPTLTATYRDALWLQSTDDTLQGVQAGYGNATGVAFYGDKPGTLAGATALESAVRIGRGRGGSPAALPTTLWLVTETDQPGTGPTRTLSTPGPDLMPGQTVEEWPLPTSWAQSMIDGTAGALAVHDADGVPFVRANGRTADPAAWALTITWSRTD